MKDKKKLRCVAFVGSPGDPFNTYQCTRIARKDGYCKQHHPGTVAKSIMELQKRYDEKQTNETVRELKNALRPFAEFAITLAQCPQGRLLPDTAPLLGPNADVSGPTIGDCRTAADWFFGVYGGI